MAIAGVLVVGPSGAGDAAGGANLVVNGGFEGSGSGSLSGWTPASANAALASDGAGGGYAAQLVATATGGYSLTTAAKVVTGAPGGEQYRAMGMVRSDAPGKTVCLRITETNSMNATVASPQQCVVTTSGWTAFPPVDITLAADGDSLKLAVRQASSAVGDSFETDSLSLVDSDITGPSAPTGLTAVASGSTAVDLSWNPSTDSGNTGVRGYVVYRNGSSTPLATLGGSVTTYHDGTVSAGPTYTYTVAAFDYAKNYSASSDPTTVTTPIPPVVGVNLVVNPGFEGSGSGSLTGWTPSSASSTLVSDGYGGGYAGRLVATATGGYSLTTASKVISGLPAGEQYRATAMVRSDSPGKSVCLRITELNPSGATVATPQQCVVAGNDWAAIPAVDVTVAAGDSLKVAARQATSAVGDTFEVDNVSLVDLDQTPPEVPTEVTAAATAASTTAIDLSWNPANDNGPAGVRGYVIYRNGATTPLATVAGTATSYHDGTLTAGATASYTIASYDFAKNYSPLSQVATATTPTQGPPTVPGSFGAFASTPNEVDLSWKPSVDNDVNGLAGYVVSRDGATLATLGPTAQGWVDRTVSPSTTYTYAVTAFDTTTAYSAAAGPVTVTTPDTAVSIDSLWHMDERDGATMGDAGQTPHVGALKNVVLGQPGDPAFPGTAYGFNGTSSLVDVGNAADLNAGDRDVRIAMSLKATNVPAVPDYDILRKGQYPGSEYKVELQPNGQFSCEFRTLQADGSIHDYVIQPPIDVHDGQWHRLTCNKVGGVMSASVDGATYTHSITGSVANGYHLVIGAYAPSGGEFFQGLLDEVSFKIG